MYKKFKQEDIDEMLPVIISDMKHEDTPEKRIVNDDNIKRGLYMNAIRGMYNKETFLVNEKEPDSGREGCFIKGYVRDVWSYLDEAYDLIHSQTYDPKKIRDKKIGEIVEDGKEN